MNCKYCGQSNTHKDVYGYCKKYACFEKSGRKQKVEKLEKDIREAERTLPTYKRNQFDNTPYNPQQQEINWLNKKISEIINF